MSGGGAGTAVGKDRQTTMQSAPAEHGERTEEGGEGARFMRRRQQHRSQLLEGRTPVKRKANHQGTQILHIILDTSLDSIFLELNA